MNGFNTGDWVWVPDQDKVMVAAEVVGNFMPGQPGSLRLDNSIFSQDGQLDVCAGTPNSTSLAAWQAQGHDKGTELGVWPGDAQLALQARQLLGF
jgi:hypothetical protein